MKSKRKQIEAARMKVNTIISAFAIQGGKFASGLAAEGYNGGYRDALDDVLLLMGGTKPDRHHFWDSTPMTRPSQPN